MKFDLHERAAARRLLEWSLDEDHARDDVTSRLAVPADARGRFVVRNRAAGVLAGIEVVELTLELSGADATVSVVVEDGTRLAVPTVLATVEGRRRDVLAAERTFLNLIGVLGGTATFTRRFVDAAGPDCTILDTR
jgi:nicotinate-nucleotide pyrophosphorylase (carboxylating)